MTSTGKWRGLVRLGVSVNSRRPCLGSGQLNLVVKKGGKKRLPLPAKVGESPPRKFMRKLYPSLCLIVISSVLFVGYPNIASGFPNVSHSEKPLSPEEITQIFNEFIPLWEQYIESADGGWKNNDNGRFTWDDTYALDGLILLYKLTKDRRYLDYCFDITDTIISSQDTTRGIQDKWRDNQVLATWSSTRYTPTKEPHVFTGDTGFIIYSLALVYNTIVQNPPSTNSSYYEDKASEILNAAQSAYQAIESDWRQVSPDSGYFRDPYFESINLDEPLNLFCLAALASLELYKATGDVDQLNKATQTVNYLNTFFVIQNGTLLWPYNSLPPYEPRDPDDWPIPDEWENLRPDDQSHGALVSLFIIRCYENNIGFTQEHIDQLIKTLTINIYKGNSIFSRYIDGLTDQTASPLAYWGYLSPYSTEVYDIFKTYHSQRTVEYNPDSFLNHLGTFSIQLYALIKHYAWVEEDELDRSDNPIRVFDVNADGTINIFDLVLIASQLGQSGDDLLGDVNHDGVVNIFDLVAMAGHLGNRTTTTAN